MSLFLLVKSASVASVSQLGVVEGEGEGAEVHRDYYYIYLKTLLGSALSPLLFLPQFVNFSFSLLWLQQSSRYRDVVLFPTAHRIPGILLLRVDTPMLFVNATSFMYAAPIHLFSPH